MPPSWIDELAALRDGQPYRSKQDPYKFASLRLATGRVLQLPGRGAAADTVVLGYLRSVGETFRRGAALLVRPYGIENPPTPIDQISLASEIRAALLALPDREDAGRLYEDLRILVRDGERATVDNYLREAIAAARRADRRDPLPEWRPPVERPDRRPALPPTQARAALRARVRAEEAAEARAWLTDWLAAEERRPGERITAGDLCALAADTVAAGPRTFYSIADEVLGRRRYSHGIRFYVIPQPKESTMNLLHEEILDRVARIAWEEQKATLRAYLDRRDTVTATGTDGACVTSLDSRRAAQ